MQSWTRPPTLSLQFGMSRSIDLSQLTHSPIYGFMVLTGHGIHDTSAGVSLSPAQWQRHELSISCWRRLGVPMIVGSAGDTGSNSGVGEVEVFQTMLGYEDDPPEMTLHRLRQTNLVGPAGLVSMEDGEAIEIVHRASRPDPDRTTIIELGGGGVISDRDYRVTDVPLRGFWSYYAELLGIEPEGAVR